MRIVLMLSVMIAGFFLLFSGCSKSSSGTPQGGPIPCDSDTSNVGYTRNVLPILQQYCYSCHGNSNTAQSDGVNLEGTDSGYKEVKGWATLGYVTGNVTYASGYIGMPYNKPRLDTCEINTLIAWVDQQYPH
jgi:hypothetical protein